jgi:TIR domain
MFNLLIKQDGTAWETDQLMRMRVDRFKTWSGSEAESISLDAPATLKSLEGMDSLLMYETGSHGPNVDLVRYGYLSEIKVVGKEVVFRLEERGTFQRTVIEEFSERLGIPSSWELGTTHWAIKDGSIPKAMRAKLMPSYDVVFSFAGEDRKYVKQVTAYLKTKKVRIFFDEYEQVHLWGKDLAEHFDLVYRRSGQFCVMFISKDYVKKMWTRHERRSALSRALKEEVEYILPARFDDTDVPGIPPTIDFMPLADKSPAKFGKIILKKLGI